MQLTPDAVRGEWHFTPTIARRSFEGATSEDTSVKWGERRFTRA